MFAQTEGSVVGHNSISIIIPCHRVIGSTGDLTSYAGGMDTQIKLLQLERVKWPACQFPAKTLFA